MSKVEMMLIVIVPLLHYALSKRSHFFIPILFVQHIVNSRLQERLFEVDILNILDCLELSEDL